MATYTGNTGKQYTFNSNGSITVNRPDGTSSTVKQGDASYNATVNAIKNDGVNYNANTTKTTKTTYGQGSSSSNKSSSGYTQPTTKNYMQGNSHLQYAMEQHAKNNPNPNGYTVNDYANSLYSRIGTQRADGSTVTLQDVDKELNRLGLQDYTSGNAIFTTGGTVLPNNEYVKYSNGNSQAPSNSADSRWATYEGRDYLIGGDSANYAQYANGKAGNWTVNDMLLGNITSNPYVQGDSDLLNAYQSQLAQIQQAGIGGLQNQGGRVGEVINLVNSMNGYGNGMGDAIYADLIASLSQGKDAFMEFLNQQRNKAQADAEAQARQAWVNSQLQGDILNEGMSALGLGTSGALQQNQLGVQNQYNQSLNSIYDTLGNMMTDLSAQELQALTDYYNNASQWKYQINNDMYNRSMQEQQLALQAWQAMQEQDYRNRMAQIEADRWNQQWNLQQQQYADERADAQYERDLAERKYQASLKNSGGTSTNSNAKVLADGAELAYKQGGLTEQEYFNILEGLGYGTMPNYGNRNATNPPVVDPLVARIMRGYMN